MVEIAVLQEAKPEKVLVVYWDTKFLGAEEFTPDDLEFTMRTDKGGGTTPQCLFDYLAKQEEPPVALVSFTDLDFYGKLPTEPPEYPTLWVTGIDVHKTAPFGKTIRVDAWVA